MECDYALIEPYGIIRLHSSRVYMGGYGEITGETFWGLGGSEPQRVSLLFRCGSFLNREYAFFKREGLTDFVESKGRQAHLHALPTREVRTNTASDCPAEGMSPPIEGTLEAIHCTACSDTSASTTETRTCLNRRIVPTVLGRTP